MDKLMRNHPVGGKLLWASRLSDPQQDESWKTVSISPRGPLKNTMPVGYWNDEDPDARDRKATIIPATARAAVWMR